MTLKKYINWIIDPIFAISLSLICLYLMDFSIIFMAILPISFTIYAFDKKYVSFATIGLATYFLANFFADRSIVNLRFLPLMLVATIFIILISLRLSAKSQILFSFFALSLIFSLLFKYRLIMNNVDIKELAIKLKDLFESNYAYKFDIDVYESSASLYPAMFSLMSMAYSIISIKLIRNYLSFKNMDISDIDNLDDIRISKKDFLYLLIGAVFGFLFFKMIGVKEIYIISNIFVILIVIFLANGLSLADNLMKNSKLPLNRTLQWFFIIILIQIIIIPLVIFGLADIFVDFRARRKNEKE